ncbi:hypothetical protein MesoLj131a_57880 [Mesorhizobium sp. 131-2-1]|nr:hypothetical protein MesoLj131a_57880 [Mesorhizobium sp. 131-2-1]
MFGTFHQSGVYAANKKAEALAFARKPLLKPGLTDSKTLHELSADKFCGFSQQIRVAGIGARLHHFGVDPRRP